jgi:hypothetical protein
VRRIWFENGVPKACVWSSISFWTHIPHIPMTFNYVPSNILTRSR